MKSRKSYLDMNSKKCYQFPPGIGGALKCGAWTDLGAKFNFTKNLLISWILCGN